MRHRGAPEKFPHHIHSQPSTQSRHWCWCQGKAGFNSSKNWILLQNYLCSRDLQNASLPSLAMGMLVDIHLPAPASYMLLSSQEPPWKQQQQRQFRPGVYISFKRIETKFVLERENDVLSPFWWQMCGGVSKFPHIIEQVKASLTITLKWLISSLQLPNAICFTGLLPFLTSMGLLSFSPCTTSSARQDMAFHIILQVPRSESAWGPPPGENLVACTDH